MVSFALPLLIALDRLEEFFYFYQNDEAETDNLIKRFQYEHELLTRLSR